MKRRKYGDFSWCTLDSAVVSPNKPYDIVWRDNLAQSDIKYEYAVVPVSNRGEGRYVSDSILTQFNGVFICEKDAIYKLYEGVAYGDSDRVQKVGVFEPYGRKYPVVTSNAQTNYDTGSLSGMILPDDYMKDGVINRHEVVDKKRRILDFLTDKKPKIIKDFNSNIWLCMITGSPTVTYSDTYGMGVVTINANWTEIGDFDDPTDLYKAQLVEGV